MANTMGKGDRLMIRIFQKDDDMTLLAPVIKSWINEGRVNEFGFDLNIPSALDDLQSLIKLDSKDLLVLEYSNKIVGFMGILFFKSPLGVQWIANEHYWYILPEYRGHGLKLINAARRWAKDKKCSHLILNASNLASELHDKVISIYEKIGMKKFETSYIEQIEGSE